MSVQVNICLAHMTVSVILLKTDALQLQNQSSPIHFVSAIRSSNIIDNMTVSQYSQYD